MIFSYLQNMQSHPSWVCGLKLTKKRITLSNLVSHPSWVCGLKQGTTGSDFGQWKVTPFVGVWIETDYLLIIRYVTTSHPSWVCGLKPIDYFTSVLPRASHPSWVCGLKLFGVVI